MLIGQFMTGEPSKLDRSPNMASVFVPYATQNTLLVVLQYTSCSF